MSTTRGPGCASRSATRRSRTRPDDNEVAAEFGAGRTGTSGEEDVFGWLNLQIREAQARAVALDDRRQAAPKRMFNYDFRPHSHHWQVMADVRASDGEVATIEVGGARMFFAMTSVDDGFFPAHVERDATGALAAVQVTIRGGEAD